MCPITEAFNFKKIIFTSFPGILSERIKNFIAVISAILLALLLIYNAHSLFLCFTFNLGQEVG
jgi:hypothetical protein